MILSVIRRFYVHNYRCLENFELPVGGLSSALLLGKNGAGKSTVGHALRLLQKIARGQNRVKELIGPEDTWRNQREAPVRLELEAEVRGNKYRYAIAFEFPEGFKEMRVMEEELSAAGEVIFSRKEAQVALHGKVKANPAPVEFRIDWHLVALPIVQEQSENDPLHIFKQWLSRLLFLQPIPAQVGGESTIETLEPDYTLTNFAAWFSGLLAYSPAAYGTMSKYLSEVLPDFKDIKNPLMGVDSRSITVQFETKQGSLSLPFKSLSEGEKCYFICALVLAANEHYGPLVCFWDEPDNYLALSEVQHFVGTLRKAFGKGGQFIATSHNPEAIRRFSDENTIWLHRRSRLEPTIARPLSEIEITGDLVNAILQDDVEA